MDTGKIKWKKIGLKYMKAPKILKLKLPESCWKETVLSQLLSIKKTVVTDSAKMNFMCIVTI